jgi:hypothetical protein
MSDGVPLKVSDGIGDGIGDGILRKQLVKLPLRFQ